MTREKSLEIYYENPKICEFCGKIIEVRENERPSDVRKKKFCNSSCSAKFNNKGKTKNLNGNNQFGINKPQDRICPICSERKSAKSEICSKCYQNSISIENKSLGYYINNQNYLSSKCSEIRKHARKVILNSGKEKICEECKNSLFNDILEVHHIKGILEFDNETLIKDINNINNLSWLCPNCHAFKEKK